MRPHEHQDGLPRRRLLQAGAVLGLAAAQVANASPGHAAARTAAGPPGIEFGGGQDQLLGAAYRSACHNLLDINTVPYDRAEYNQTGLMTDSPGTFIRAGGGYEQPWTRDAAVNSWNAASFLTPQVARNTLWAVCRRQDDGTLIVQQDNQWWDQIVWAVAAWHHYLVTGDRPFLADAFQSAVNTLRADRDQHHNERYGLFEGPAFLQDGIAGYPAPPADPDNPSSFVLDHPGTDKMMCLSTNCLFHAGYLATAAMAQEAGDRRTAREFRLAAARLRTAINAHLWRPSAGTYGYFIHGAGERAGRLETYQEANGLAFAVLCGVASRSQARTVLDRTHHEPHGVVNVWPHFERFDDQHPGRHNAIVWPMTVGMWGHAAAVGGRTDLLARAVTDIASLEHRDGHFWEIHNALTGAVDGGWQNARHWGSEPDQTWSATGYLRLIHQGVFGIRYAPDGIRFAPNLPPGWGPVTLHGLPYRDMTLDITLTGSGRRVASSTVDGHHRTTVPAGLRGRHRVRIELR
ncbi:MGH1-like glycoside hydrolase domain-containing protein [Streptomyces sp. NPDC088727]|uniref:MGH1-like glycoside hydrolase domain-containing protein n=1 Tax=Streptomyces sp. NPDC088727 TaxID=3365875 RepID=UPI003827D5EB